MDGVTVEPARGTSQTALRDVRCKDCLREEQRGLAPESTRFEYNEDWAQRIVNRGGTRTDRCPRHRRLHRLAIQGMAVAYVDLQTIGEVRDRANPTGPLGGLGELPDRHAVRQAKVDLAQYKFGMTDQDIVEILAELCEKRVLILRAGTGTGKSTFAPFRLMNPPDYAPIRLTEYGPIIVTEPRVQATTGVARFVGEKLVLGCLWRQCSTHGWFERDHPGELSDRCQINECARHIGPGYPVGYQVKGDKNHDDSCQLIYVTDGTMINWLKEGRLSRIGTVIVDEAHERSTNIDFVLGYLKRELDRHPHLGVIVTSATFDVDFYVQYFGGPDRVAWKDVPPAKSFGYGDPLFPAEEIQDVDAWILRHWPERHGPVDDDGYQEDLWATTRVLHDLRSARVVEQDRWRTEMPTLLTNFLVDLVGKLDDRGVYGDILAFLPTEKTITPAVEAIRKALPEDKADVFALLSSIDTRQKEAALAARPRGSKRKVVVSTNLAETSLTVSGVRFVVDSGLICQDEWNPATASRSLPTKPHSQAGVRQRWGRVGRDNPGWVFPLYTRAQFGELAQETPPASSRSNLEQLYTKAKAGGIDDPLGFPWPAGFVAAEVELDETARRATANFRAEIARSEVAARANGIVDAEGHLTPYGRELDRFAGITSAAAALATMYADQLACVPEVVTALVLLEGRALRGSPKPGRHFLLPSGQRWPAEWKVQAATRHKALVTGCLDDLDLVLRIAAAWESMDSTRPWTDSSSRREWAASWWIDHDVLLRAAVHRHDILSVLSPAMKEETKRPLEPHLVPRARAVLSRAMQSMECRRVGENYQLTSDPSLPPGVIDPMSLPEYRPERVIALQRRSSQEGDAVYLQNLIAVYPWAAEGEPDAFELLQRCADRCSPRSLPIDMIDQLPPVMKLWPVGGRFLATLTAIGNGAARVEHLDAARAPFGYSREVEARAATEEAEDAGDDEAITTDEDADSSETGWPTGNPDPHEDDEIADRFTVLDPEDPTNGLESNDTDETVDLAITGPPLDVVAEWRSRASSSALPSWDVVADSAVVTGQATWTTCVGYDLAPDTGARPILAADWLAPDLDGDPSLHPDVATGAEIDLIVGPILTDSRQQYRAFNRADGRGRFLLPTAARRTHGEPPAALDPNDRELLLAIEKDARVQGIVVPGQSATKSISLLPTLARHLNNGERQQHVAPGSTSSRRVPFWPAVITAVPADEQWGRVQLSHHDEATGIRHEFGLRWTTSGLDAIEPQPGMAVLVNLRTHTSARLQGNADLLSTFAEQFPQYVQVRTDGNKRVLQARQQLPAGVRDALLAANSSGSWARRVWTFYLQSHARRIGAILPMREPAPRRPAVPSRDAYRPFRAGLVVVGTVAEVKDTGVSVAFRHGALGFATAANLPGAAVFQAGEPVIARVHLVEAEKRRLVLNLREPYVFAGNVPTYWQDPMSRHHDRIAQAMRGEYDLRGPTLTARFLAPEAAEHGLATLRALLALPAADVRVPAQRKGKVIGPGGSTIRRLRGIPGLWTCDFIRDTDSLILVGESADALRYALREVMMVAAGAATGTMTVPNAAANGALIGKGGEVISRLKRESGCLYASSARGSVTWTIKADSETSIRRFIELAAGVVPGCTGQVIGVEEPPVVDVSTGAFVSDWRSHRFGIVRSPDWLDIAPVQPFDLRPGTEGS